MVKKIIVQSLREKVAPYLQILGWMAVMFSMFVTCILFYAKGSEAIANVAILMEWKASTATDIAVIKQDVQDIHEYLMPGRK